VLGAAAVLFAYRRWVQPWHQRWGATEPNRYLVAGDREGGSWCLALRPGDGGTRLVSRWRVRWPLTPATVFWVLVSDPGAFIMERRMLKGIKHRVEGAAVRPAA
jgi:hypothetical protein